MPNPSQNLQAANATKAVIKPSRPILRVIQRDGSPQYFWLHKGKQGSIQTAAQMARLVREDTVKDQELQKWAARILINNGLNSHSNKRDIVMAIFSYVKQFHYIHDPAGAFDAIQSARQTIEKGFGDCDDLSVLLATLLAQVGLQPRFVLARYKPNSKGYDHVYVDVVLPQSDGGRLVLDPSSARRGAGWESLQSIERLTYPIFSGPVSTLGSAVSLATTGAAIGLNFVPVVGPLLSALVGPVSGLFDRTQQRSEEAARDQYRDAVYQGLNKIEGSVNACQTTPQAGVAAGRELIGAMYQACDQFTKASVAKSCRNYESQDYPGGPQEGAFVTRLNRISKAGAGCRSAGGATASGGASSSSENAPGAPSSNLPLIIIAVVGGYFVLKALR